MASTAGWRARVRVPGAPVAITNEATTANGARTEYQITNALRRVLDPQVAAAVQQSADGVTWTAATGYTLNRLTGTVVFAVARASGTQVRIASASYLPLVTAALAHGYSWTVTAEQIKATDFDGASAAAGFETGKTMGVSDASGTLDRWWIADNFFTNSLLQAGVIVLELMPDRASSTPDLLAWAVISKEVIRSATGSIVGTTVDWQGTPDADRRVISKG